MQKLSKLVVRPLAAAVLVFAFFDASRAAAQISFSPSDKPLVSISIELPKTAGADGNVRGTVIAKIDSGWHISSAKPLDEFSIPTKLEIDSPALELTSVDYPPHIERTFTFAGGSKVAVYEGTIRIPFVAKLKGASGPVHASLRYQACNDSICLPPKTASADAKWESASVATPPATTTSKPGEGSAVPTSTAVTPAPAATTTAAPPVTPSPAPQATVATPRAGFVPLSAGRAPSSSLFGSDIQATFTSRGLLLTLLVIFVLGLALNLTPCVYPLIPLTLAYFSAQGSGKRSTRVALAVSYVLGLALTYSALGVFSALSGRLFGGWLQHPAVLMFFALLMLVLASSMFGLFEITVPHFISDRAGARAGVAGAMTMGLLAGIVAAPCVGPFVISLITLVGQIGSVWLGFLLFFVLALGLGLPYLILGIFSSALNAIPRSGAWMVQIKKALGFILIAMAFYFLRPMIGDEAFRWGVAASLVVGAVFLFVKAEPNPRANAIRIASAILLLVSGVAFAMPRRAAGELTWQPYSEKAIAEARAAGKPVMIDFYADWCQPCKELDHETFTDKNVTGEAERFVRLKADMTRSEDAKTVSLQKTFGVLGVPTVLFIDSNGNEVATHRLSGFEKPEHFLERLKAVR